ncbi:MAG: hypothetical protein CM15mP74_34820 [Halieaceae bacterium]|nr:MAG: hypothetical protein CM15mP74_34820 [Halieaceae bacterium]
MRSTATELEEITVIRQSVAPRTPSRSVAVALHVNSGMNTHFRLRKISHKTSAMTASIAVPKVTKSDSDKGNHVRSDHRYATDKNLA